MYAADTDLRSFYFDYLRLDRPPGTALADLLATVPEEFHAALRLYFQRTGDHEAAAAIK